MRYKYSRTMHLPFSKGLQNDDRMVENLADFEGKVVEVSVKMDGENTSCYSDGLHARSLSSAHHPSRCWIKSFHATLKYSIPDGWRFVFENMYAKHSIFYENLESYAYLISIWNEQNYCLSLDSTVEIVSSLGLVKVPTIKILEFDLDEIEQIYLEQIEKGEEGIVIRNVDTFHYDDFGKNVAKAVRPNHIQTDQHWMNGPVMPNKLC